MEFRLLGPLEVLEDGRAIDIGAAKPRALLAVLLLNANRVVRRDKLVDALWGERAPSTAQKALQVYVSQLRKSLDRERILTRPLGYELRVDPGELDLEQFSQLVEDQKFAEALLLRRGAPLADFAYEPFAQSEIARLDELMIGCLEQRVDADLAAGRQAALVPELEALVGQHPLREHLRVQLMLALYRSGRQAEALDAYQAGRVLLSDELGLEPSPELKELQHRILVQDPTLDLPRRSLQVEAERPTVPHVGLEAVRQRQGRKSVTVLSCDVTASGFELDPESLRRMTARAFDELVPVLEGHGARVERSLGGAVSAIFGIPVVHEDDALRAARAAVEMRDRLDSARDELVAQWGSSLELRVGIGTGAVLVDASGDRPLATGQPVLSAIRLQQAASPGELLVDERTYVLIGDAAEVEALGDHARLVGVRPVELDTGRRFDPPMVGRERERRRLHDAFEQAHGDRVCQLFTIIGAAGVGKSRLVREFVRDVSDRALIARGRCLPYGEGITYWPVLEAVRDAAGLDDAASREQNLARLEAVLRENDEARLVAQRLGEVVGLSEHSSGAEETFWAVRMFVETLARRRPLVVVFDDIHWAEPTFLDLVDHVAEWVSDAPVLLVCIARPELLDVRQQWGGGKANATSVRLEPLSELESETLLHNLAGPGLEEDARQRIVEAAGGNPLFVEEMLALLLEEGRDRSTVEVPATIQALLAARLDRLPDEERTVIEAAAVEGKVFHEASVAELTATDLTRVHEALLALARRDLVRSERHVFSGERAFRFRHLLIRDAAYDSIPKETRAVLHERHAAWLEKVGEHALELEEIIGYHFEQAFRYRSELGPIDEGGLDLGFRAGRRLGLAGRRALARGDTPAALNLVSRAAALLPANDPLRVHVVPGVRIVQGLGGQLGWAEAVLNEAISTGEPRLQAHARVQRALLNLFTETTVDVDELASVATDAIGVFEKLRDELGLARAWRLLQQAHYLGRQSAPSADAAEQALVHARRAEDVLEEVEIIDWLGVALFMGATPADEAERRVESHLAELHAGRSVEAVLLACLAGLKAMQGELADARALIDRAQPVVDELAYISRLSVVPFHAGLAELLADDPAAAERVLRATLEPLEAVGETSTYSAIVAVLAQAVYRQGRYREAEDLTRISEAAAHLNDVFAHVTWRPVRAKALARRGQFAEAERLAEEAIAFAAKSDFLNARGDALLDFAELLEMADRSRDALPMVEQAIELYEQKGNVVSAARARARLELLASAV
jgi:predicted ATPase/DNA-binding SARP family transcriptional activator